MAQTKTKPQIVAPKVTYPRNAGASQRAALDLIAERGWVDLEEIATTAYSITSHKNYRWRILREKEWTLREFFGSCATLNSWLVDDRSFGGIGWHVKGHPEAEAERSRRREQSLANDCRMTVADTQKTIIDRTDAFFKSDRIAVDFANDAVVLLKSLQGARSRAVAFIEVAPLEVAAKIASKLGAEHLTGAIFGSSETSDWSPKVVAQIALLHPKAAAQILCAKSRGKNQKMIASRLRLVLELNPNVSIVVDAEMAGYDLTKIAV